MPEVTNPNLLKILNRNTAQPQSGPQVETIYTAPDPQQDIENDYRGATLGNSNTQTNLAVEGNERGKVKDLIGNADTLKARYEQLPEIKQYRTTARQFYTALQLPPDATGDATLLYQYAKTMDPTGSVMEGDSRRIEGLAPVIQQKVNDLQRQFGIGTGGKFPADIREGLKRDMLTSLQSMGLQYRQQRQRFAADANAVGIEPARVIGPDDFDPYLPKFNEWMAKQGKANNPTQQDVYSQGIRRGDEMSPDAPFDRERYLADTFGITPEKEARISAFWQANSGNDRLTPEAAAQWYQQNGITVPPLDALAQTVEQAKRTLPGTAWGGIDTSGAEKAYRERLRGDLQAEGFDPTSGGAFGARAIRGAEMGLSDEIEGIGGAVNALFNNQGVADGYRLSRDRVREAYSQMEDQQGALGTAAELAGGLVSGLAIPSGAARGVAGMARQGAAQGAVAGYGYGEGLDGSLGGAALGAGIGAVGGAAFGKGGEVLAARAANRATQPLTDGGEVIAAADRLNDQFGTNLAPIPADVAGVTTRRLTGGASQLPLAAGSIVGGAQKVSNEAQKALDAIAGLAGGSTTREAAGEAALTGAQAFIKNSRSKVEALYTKAKALGGSEPVDLVEARKALDAETPDLQGVPGGSKILEKVAKLRADLDGTFPVQGVRQMRTEWRDEFIKDNLRGTNLERIVNKALDAADQDIVSSLNARGKGEAARLYAEAAAAHKERIGVIDQVLAPIIGNKGEAPKSFEQVLTALETATKTNGGRLGKFLSSLPPEDAASVRGTLVQELGRANAGAQNAAGDAFSIGSFLTNWNKMSGSAKSQMFGGELRAALEDLARVAQGSKEAQRFANSSNTGSVVGGVALGANLASFFAAPVSSTAALLGQYGAGKLLASPKFARWLAKMPSNPALAEKHVSALSKIAANDNVIAADVTALQQELMAQFGSGVRASASPPIAAPPASSNAEGTQKRGGNQ